MVIMQAALFRRSAVTGNSLIWEKRGPGPRQGAGSEDSLKFSAPYRIHPTNSSPCASYRCFTRLSHCFVADGNPHARLRNAPAAF